MIGRQFKTGWPVLLLLLTFGCQQSDFSRSVWNPFGLEMRFNPQQDPVRIGVIYQETGPLAPENWLLFRKAPPYSGLRVRLAEHLDRPVQMQQLKPFQVAAHLKSGRLHYALVSEGDYGTLSSGGPAGRILGRGVQLRRRGVIVASAGSDIHMIEELRGKRFALGPKGDPVLDEAALQTLADGGVPRDEIKKEWLTLIPNIDRLQYHISSKEVAKEVVYGLGTDAGVIEESEFRSYPAEGGRLFPLRFSKNQFRVLGYTDPVAVDTVVAGPFLVSEQADPKLTAKIVEFLSTAHQKHPQALEAVGLARFDMSPTRSMASQKAGEPVPES